MQKYPADGVTGHGTLFAICDASDLVGGMSL